MLLEFAQRIDAKVAPPLTQGVPIETVSKMLGHTSIKTTQIYARIVDSKISKEMEKLKLTLSKTC